MKIVKSNLRWPGGKSKMTKILDKFFPKDADKYLEVFTGGGSVLLHIVQKLNPSIVYANDIDSNLINYYNEVKNNPQLIIDECLEVKNNNIKETFAKEFSKLDSNVKELKNRYDKNMIDTVAIIAIFIAVSIGMVSGISFSLQAFENVTDLNVFTMGLTISTIGFVIFNLFYALFKFVSKLCGKDLDKKGNFVFVDVVFILLIVFFTILIV